MIKKYKIFLLFLCLCFFIHPTVKAEDNVCTFSKNLTITFKDDGTSVLNQDFYDTKNEDFLIYQSYAGSVETNSPDIQNQITSLKGSCPSKVYYCKIERGDVKILTNLADNLFELVNNINEDSTVSGVVKDALRMVIPSLKVQKMVFLYNSKADAKGEYLGIDLSGDDIDEGIGFDLVDKLVAAKSGDIKAVGLAIAEIGETILRYGIPDIYYRSKECGYVEYTGDKPTYNLACTYTRGFLNEYTTIAGNYKSCGNNSSCKSQKITDLNVKENQLKTYCKNILENYNYDSDVEQDCIDSCLIISDNIKAVRKEVGLDSVLSGKCGFSARLGSWGLNIMKWVKYIIPVIVIILGILDFIKAIGADKEDEMKKSQKKFITRLIAAALIFIVPFIIEFALDKFGFTEYIDGCGIIKEI